MGKSTEKKISLTDEFDLFFSVDGNYPINIVVKWCLI